ncbi:MAG TPA: hydantoinase/oxoprolinase family protein [Gammaproteobacteria bacterium]|nr:hydantoinase/oxoprolinase family protein [Gammaproteobacteria bacterium]
MHLLGIDTGGTFTDFVYLDGADLRVHKVLSTPQAPERAILQGIADLGLDSEGLTVIHGSTVATNAVLEGKGARTAYIANHGLGDALSIGRQARRELYNLHPEPKVPPVKAELCLEIGGRIAPDGAVLEPLDDPALARLTKRLLELKPRAVAINLLYSFLDDRFERAIEAVVPEGIFVSRSSMVLPEQREYERGIATWLNSYVGPLMQGYLRVLRGKLPGARVKVMQSHGGTIDAAQAGAHAVQLLLSGPAGGLMGARHVAAASGFNRLLTFDMGGTSTDVALIDGDMQLTSEGRISDYPVAVPMVDLHTIGAGGGSIARVDAGGLLKVGPESAGADPGPACYDRGGSDATVTDANLVLGRLPADMTLGGRMKLDIAAAQQALSTLASRLGLDMQSAAEGIVQLATEHMAQALRVISVQRGLDPRDYVLVSFGGAGGLHVCELAEKLGMSRALVPVHAGVLSALGMLVAPQGRQLSQTLNVMLKSCTDADIEGRLESLAARGDAELKAEGVTKITRAFSLDLRYQGQSSTLRVSWQGITQSEQDFHAEHRKQFGHALEMPIELVNIRVGLHADITPPALPHLPKRKPAAAVARVEIHGINAPVPLYQRATLACSQHLPGPALIAEASATTLITDGWDCKIDEVGNLLLQRR